MELRKAIKALIRGEAEGPDEILAEALKADAETSASMLHHLTRAIWEVNKVLLDWRDDIIVKISKKRDRRGCKTTEE